jgi:predicted DNA-binding transcriptional regulator AlpA
LEQTVNVNVKDHLTTPPDPKSAGNRLWTAREVYEFLRIDKRSFFRLLATGGFPRPIRIGRRLRWTGDQVFTWLNAQAA